MQQLHGLILGTVFFLIPNIVNAMSCGNCNDSERYGYYKDRLKMCLKMQPKNPRYCTGPTDDGSNWVGCTGHIVIGTKTYNLFCN